MSQKSITKNYIYNLVYQVLILVLPIITTPYISRVLGATNVGIYSYTYTNLSYFILFGALGVYLYGQREIAYAGKDESKRKQIFWEIVIFRFITMAIAIIIYYIALVQNSEYHKYYAIWSLELLATAFDIGWFFQGMEDFKKTVTRNVLVRLISVTLIFIIVKNEADLFKYITIYAIADLLGNLSLWLYLPRYFKGIKVNNIQIWAHLVPIVMLFIPQISNQIYNMLDKTMLGKMITDKSEAGFYEEGQKVIRVLLTITTSLGIVMVPRMASIFATGDKEKAKEYLKKSFRFVFFLAFPIIFGIVSISEAFVPMFFGPGYEKSSTLINILSPTILLAGVANVVGVQYLLPAKKQKEYTISIVTGLIVNFILNYILILKYDSIGASISTVLSELLVVVIQIYLVRREISIKEILSLTYTYFFAGIVMFMACLITKHYLGITVGAMITQIVVGIIVYAGILFIIKDEFLYMFLDKAKSMIRRK